MSMTKKEKDRYQRAIDRACKALMVARDIATKSIHRDMERRVHDPRTSFDRVQQLRQAFDRGQMYRTLDESLRLAGLSKHSFF